MDEQRAQPAITAYFSVLEDPRRYNRRHKLLDIVVIAICAAICGAEGWEDIELFGETKEEWLRGFLELPHGAPSDDTYRRVFAALDASEFQSCFMDWIEAVEVLTQGQVIAVDGKTLRRSHDRSEGKKALQMVSAWASANGLVLGQRKVDGESNEITAVPELLDALEIAGCTVTLDAIHCQTETVETIVDKEADYVLPVKENQPRLLEALQGLFDDPAEMRWVECGYHRTEDRGHGRVEVRECWSTSDPEYLNYIGTLAEWQGLQSIAMIQSERQLGDQTTVSRRYFISSLTSDAERLLKAVRGHWGIENKVHWVLDIAFREDDCRIRKGHGAENFAVLRHIALNLLRRETSAKRSIRGKRMKAALDEKYLFEVLTG
ncbi:MAG: ISAs1 family transposase [Anaerolineae bacterium]|nr:ISAs1 family transposase [Anaerolineae bacterium]